MSNPKLAIDSLLETTEKIDEITIYPITVARYALLELVDSPFLGRSEFNYANIIPSWYIMTQPTEKLKGYNSKKIDQLFADSLVESEKYVLNDFIEFVKLMTQKLVDINKVSPEAGGKEGVSQRGKKLQTDG